MKISHLLLCALLPVFCLSCEEQNPADVPQGPAVEEPVGPGDEPVEPTPVPEKEKMIWIDASANISTFQSKANILHFMDKIQEAGFNKIVVDIKPTVGDVLYDSELLPKVTRLGGRDVVLSFDYLGYFIEQAKKRDMKVTVSTTIFTMGKAATKLGPAFTDPRWEGTTCIQYTPDGMLDIKDDPSKVAVFLNPVLPEVQDFMLEVVKEILLKYDVDAYALDYCRYCDYQSDYSPASQAAFEKYLGEKVENFPQDIFTYNSSGGMEPGKYFRQWWAFRAHVISDFIARVEETIESVKPEVELEYWAASWWQAIYGNGQNWGSPSHYDGQYQNSYNWYSPEYAKAGFADHLDTFLLGSYLSTIEGRYNPSSIEYAINRANTLIGDDCKIYATISVADKTFDVENAVYYCLMNSEGLMVFDIVHVMGNKFWDEIKAGIDRAEKDMAAQNNE